MPRHSRFAAFSIAVVLTITACSGAGTSSSTIDDEGDRSTSSEPTATGADSSTSTTTDGATSGGADDSSATTVTTTSAPSPTSDRRCGAPDLQNLPPDVPITEVAVEWFSTAIPEGASGALFAAEAGFVVFSGMLGITAFSPDGRTWETFDILDTPPPASFGFVPQPHLELWERTEAIGLGGQLELRNVPADGSYDLCLDGSEQVWRLPFREETGWSPVRLVGATDEVVVLVVTEVVVTPLLLLDGRFEMVLDGGMIDVETGDVLQLEPSGDGGWNIVSTTSGEVAATLSGEQFATELELALVRRDATTVPHIEYLAWSTDPAAGWNVAALPDQSPEQGVTAIGAAVGDDGTVVLDLSYSPGRLVHPDEAGSITSQADFEALISASLNSPLHRAAFVVVAVGG